MLNYISFLWFSALTTTFNIAVSYGFKVSVLGLELTLAIPSGFGRSRIRRYEHSELAAANCDYTLLAKVTTRFLLKAITGREIRNIIASKIIVTKTPLFSSSEVGFPLSKKLK